jgi:G6PDH family F420-dependent oxidoreductase
VARRQEILREAIQIIRELFSGELVDWKGEHFEVDSARLWDIPETPVAIATAVSGERSVETFAPLSDHLIAVEPNKDFVDAWHDARRATGLPGQVRVIGQIPICWDPDRDKAIRRAHDQFRWFGGGWAVNADLPTTAGFDGATQYVRPEDVAESIPCGPDLDAIVDAVRKYWEAGFTDVALVQIGDENQDLFLKEAAGSLLEKLRSESN